jgi:predicted molibdopterin-dependent oxidoreductase YjgC
VAQEQITITINGQSYVAYKGQSLLSVLIENGIFSLKQNAVSGQNRFGICGMGTCFECEVQVMDQGIRRACLANLDAEMNVKTGDYRE